MLQRVHSLFIPSDTQPCTSAGLGRCLQSPGVETESFVAGGSVNSIGVLKWTPNRKTLFEDAWGMKSCGLSAIESARESSLTMGTLLAFSSNDNRGYSVYTNGKPAPESGADAGGPSSYRRRGMGRRSEQGEFPNVVLNVPLYSLESTSVPQRWDDDPTNARRSLSGSICSSQRRVTQDAVMRGVSPPPHPMRRPGYPLPPMRILPSARTLSLSSSKGPTFTF